MGIKKFEKRIYLSSPTMHQESFDYMKEAYDTNWMSTVGENINEVERIMGDHLGHQYAVALASGTAAIHLAVKLAGVKPGDKVFCSDLTFSATVNPVVYEGGVPIFIDSEYETWNMDPAALEKAFELHPEVKVVMLVHLYGAPAKVDEIRKICKEHDAILIEDAAESLGATYKGEQTGTFGDYNIISFNGNKIITGSTGGMLLTNCEEDALKVRKWSTQSREEAPWYQHEELGYNYRMSNVVAGVVRGQMQYLEKHIAQKKAIYERYKEGFKNLPVVMNPYDENTSQPNYWLSCMTIHPEAMCKQEIGEIEGSYVSEEGKSCPIEIWEALTEANVESRPIWKPMHLQPLYKNNEFISLDGQDVGKDIFMRGLCLPSDNKMTPEEQDKIIEIIRNCFGVNTWRDREEAIMEKRQISFSPPDMTEEEIVEVASAIKSGWITTGPKTKEFERKIADYLGMKRAVCLNSQTACAEMALHVLGVGPGDEVIVPAYTYTATASVVCHVGAKLVMVDIQENSLEMDYEKLEEAITENTKVIIPVDLAGIPCDYQKIYEIVEKKKHLFKPSNEIQKAMGRISVNADGAHAFGAELKGKKVGNFADFTSFSFHAVKNLTTAEGGALTWRPIEGIDDEAIYHQIQLLSLHGQSKDAFSKVQLGAWEYDIEGPWYKCNMTDIMAGIGLAQMKRYSELLERRKEIIGKYDAAFKPLGVEVLEHYTDEHQSSGHLYLTRIPGITLEQRQEIIVKMAEAGIATNVHYKPLPMMTAYKKFGFDIKDYPNAYKHFENEITLPLHTCLTDEDVEYIIENYCRIIKEYL